ncbi:MAG: transposase [Spirochaetaceae bacterium]|nr:transposase [Spirochaetaceae bacterium]
MHEINEYLSKTLQHYENQKDVLANYLDCEFLTPSNNFSERCVLKIINWRKKLNFAESVR